MKGAGEWFRKLRDIGIRAVIVSDPALIMIAATEAPGLEIHLSTQASATTMKLLNSGKNLAWRVSFWRVRSLWKNWRNPQTHRRWDRSLRTRSYVYFLLWSLYSFKPHEYAWCQPWWLFSILPLEIRPYDSHLVKNVRIFKGRNSEEFSMSAVDMSMIDHIPDMIENGVDSLKIEGRMKSIHYVSTVTNCYRPLLMPILRVLKVWSY